MRNNTYQRIGFFIVVITACLLFSNCRILQKSKSEFTEKQKSEIDSVLKSEGFEKIDSEFNQEQSSTYDFSNDKFSELFKLNYQPWFDASGNIIPLIFKHTKNGQTEEFYLSGGNLNQEKSTTSDKIKEVISNKINTKYKSEITYKTHTTYKTQTTYVTKIKEKEKDLKSYDFSFWYYVILIGFILINLGITIDNIISFYKKPQSELKSFIQRIFNGKN